MNKLLWFLALLSVSCANSVSSLVEKETSPSMPQCNPATVEWFPHPYSCEMFVLCFHGNPIEKSCAPKLHFSAEQRKCMLPRLAECDISAFCPEVDDEMNPVFLADKNDCTKYFVCFSGKAIERSCAKGLFFDVKSKWCTFPENVTCDPRTPNAPIIKPQVPIDTSICEWHGNVNDLDGSFIKSVCYFNLEKSYEESLNNCQSHGMRLMRVEDSTVQSATIAYLSTRFGIGTNGIYYVSGRNNNGTWYHDDSTKIYENMIWRSEGRPESGCLILNNISSMTFDAIHCSNQIHSICEFNKPI